MVAFRLPPTPGLGMDSLSILSKIIEVAVDECSKCGLTVITAKRQKQLQPPSSRSCIGQ
ncbi:hypothetical protein BFJ63_vAg2477 [Fusarium oxysporum f. sp. narcissi]|uniref:Uncharacterized protein n=1 Tax=Fusarium oxysporum f. sp. narcissi TaxID=451672 RepID=A0A4Q2W5Z7_FUSOX|nr:hypothetical protein BFJ63_vAg2477 [Fusarium oxysporum f. sp. narcissi]